MRTWWLDELRSAGAEHLDPAFVAGYDRKARFDPSADVAVLRGHGLGPGTRVVDLGAGTGTFALAAAATGARVTAVDISPAMVAAIRRRVASSPDAARIDVVEAGFLGFVDDRPPADFVFTRNALHQLPDLWKVIALRRIAALLRPGGILRLRDLVLDVEPDGVEAALDGWVASAAGDPATGYTAADVAEHLRAEFSTYTWLFEAMLERSGFEILERTVPRRVFAAYTCRRPG